jgi:hypothetical protein
MPPSSHRVCEGVLQADAGTGPPFESDVQCMSVARNLLLMLANQAAGKESLQHRIYSLLSTQRSSFSSNSMSGLFLLLFGPDLLILSERLASYGCMSQPAALGILERASRDVEAILHARLPHDNLGDAIRRAADEARSQIPPELGTVHLLAAAASQPSSPYADGRPAGRGFWS